MCLLHKYRKIAESPKWRADQCNKCGKVKWIEKFYGGYQPKPLLPGESEPEPPTQGMTWRQAKKFFRDG